MIVVWVFVLFGFGVCVMFVVVFVTLSGLDLRCGESGLVFNSVGIQFFA